eukprot:4585007-Pyramimonas_sp.AAC.1
MRAPAGVAPRASVVSSSMILSMASRKQLCPGAAASCGILIYLARSRTCSRLSSSQRLPSQLSSASALSPPALTAWFRLAGSSGLQHGDRL